MFLNDSYRPITDSAGFINCPAGECARQFMAWMEEIRPGAHKTRSCPAGALSTHLSSLCPLVKGGITREVFVPVQEDWTAYFDNGWRGTDSASVLPVISTRLRCTALHVSCTPDLSRRGAKRYGARIVGIYRGAMRASRSLWVANDGGRWVAGSIGDPAAEEDEEWMTPVKVRDRFTDENLRTLVARFVPGVWDLARWLAAEAFLIERVGALPSSFNEIDLESVQESIPTRAPKD